MVRALYRFTKSNRIVEYPVFQRHLEWRARVFHHSENDAVIALSPGSVSLNTDN
jgi:hypothetical protein